MSDTQTGAALAYPAASTVQAADQADQTVTTLQHAADLLEQWAGQATAGARRITTDQEKLPVVYVDRRTERGKEFAHCLFYGDWANSADAGLAAVLDPQLAGELAGLMREAARVAAREHFPDLVQLTMRFATQVLQVEGGQP
jgi:hypothetical protein